MRRTTSPASEPPSPETIAELLAQWVDPITEEPPGTRYCLYPTPARGANTQGSYLVYLPPSYEQNDSKRYPVIYWLHAGFQSARQGAWAVQKYDTAIRANLMPEVIIVLPQALPVGWYVDSKDGKLPIEQVIIKNLIPHIDINYRTIARKEGRGIEGHSMGGFGALHLGLKFTNLFGAISAIVPSILRNLNEEPVYRTYYTFNGDQNYYEEVGPWSLAKLNAKMLNEEKIKIRILCGEYDSCLLPALQEYHEWLKKLNIRHKFVTVKGAGHDYREIFEGYGQGIFTFWSNAFKDLE